MRRTPTGQGRQETSAAGGQGRAGGGHQQQNRAAPGLARPIHGAEKGDAAAGDGGAMQ